MVCQLDGEKPAAALTPEESKEISRRLLRQKEQTIWQAWITDMRKNTKIEMYKEI